MRSLDDPALVAAMREDHLHAWAEFDTRVRPVLRSYATRVARVPGLTEQEVIEALVDDVIADEGMRLTTAYAPAVRSLAAYLLRAARHRLLNLRRGSDRRARRTAIAVAEGPASDGMGSFAVACVSPSPRRPGMYAVAAHVLPASAHEEPSNAASESVVARLAATLRAVTTIEEQQMLHWVAQRIPYRTIAAWSNVGYEAAAKRIARLIRRLRVAAVQLAEAAEPGERLELERFLRRVGALPPLVLPPGPRYPRYDVASPIESHQAGPTVAPNDDRHD